MEAIFEAKYINIAWVDKNTALSITESNDSIPLNKINNNEYQLDTVIYPEVKTEKNKRQLGQLAFHITKDTTIPYFDGSTKLRSVIDSSTGKKWWIEEGEWSSETKRWQSEMFRSTGEVILNIGRTTCAIRISASSFSYEQLELYLQDFKNDFWHLILNENNHIKAEAKTKKVTLLDESSITYLNQFIDFENALINNPKKELHEIQVLQSYKKVRPVPRTFMEIVTKGQQKLLTSRGYKESYNVSENKYVYYIVNKIHLLLENLTKLTSRTSDYQDKRIKGYENRLNNFQDFEVIDKEGVENEIIDFEKSINKVNDRFQYAITNQNSNYNKNNTEPVTDIEFKVTNTPKIDDYNANLISMNVKSNLTHGLKEVYKFEASLFKNTFQRNDKYRMTATVFFEKKEPKSNQNFKPFFIITIKEISNLTVISYSDSTKLESSIVEKNTLEINNWKRKLTDSEKKEQNKERTSIEKAIELSEKQQKLNASLTEEFKPLLSKIIALKKKFKTLGIQPDSSFPNSMTFIQNPNYQGVHKLYKQIMGLSGLDETLFLGLQEVEKIGILNIALIYERWCLLQIIRVLVEVYKFLPEENWKHKLIEQILNSGRNVEIKFENTATQRKITLWYEKVLASGKRPDFILDVTSSFSGNNAVHCLVMDAKFYEEINNNSFKGISTIINQLYHHKNYSENGENSVFILHPSKNAVPKKKTPQKWAKDSYYGETQMFDWGENIPNHQYGAVLLSPISNSGNYLDDLHRLIGMFLQYGIENNRNCRSNPVPENIFCLVCGSENDYEQPSNTKSRWITCKQCQHFTAYNYCGGCGNRLIKHGSYWTYHATRSSEPFNIKCPSCGDYLDLSNK